MIEAETNKCIVLCRKHHAEVEMKKYRIPASITLAQGILESGIGEGRLAVIGNNHFGIKCHKKWNGKKDVRCKRNGANGRGKKP